MHDQKPGPARGEGRGGNLLLFPRPRTLWGALQKFFWKIKHITRHWGELHLSTFPGPRSEGVVAPGGTFFGGAHFGFQIPHVKKVLSECKKCHFRDPNFKTFQGQHALGPPRSTRLTVCTYTPWGGRHFKNSPLVELLFTTPLLQHKSLSSWIDNSDSYILFYNRHSLTLHVLWFYKLLNQNIGW